MSGLFFVCLYPCCKDEDGMNKENYLNKAKS